MSEPSGTTGRASVDQSDAGSRLEVLEAIMEGFLRRHPIGRRTIGIDGAAGAGKTMFADELALLLRQAGSIVFRASVDDFHRPRAYRVRRGRFDPDGYYRDAFDYDALRHVLIDPFRSFDERGFQRRWFDLERDVLAPRELTTGPINAILLVDGVLIQRPELAGLWDWTVFLDVDVRARHVRMIERDGADPEPGTPHSDRYEIAQLIYEDEADPRRQAAMVIDNSDALRPKIVKRPA